MLVRLLVVREFCFCFLFAFWLVVCVWFVACGFVGLSFMCVCACSVLFLCLLALYV